MQHGIYIYRHQWNLGQICYIFKANYNFKGDIRKHLFVHINEK